MTGRTFRALHVQKVKGIGGCERHLLSLLPALTAAGDQVRLVVLGAGQDEMRMVDAAQEADVDVIVIPSGTALDPRPARAVAEQIRRFSPDVVHTHLVHADLWGQLASRWCRVPGVRTLHNVMPAYTRPAAGSAGRLAGRLAARSIAISRAVATFARRHRLAPADRLSVIPYGIDASAWSVSDRGRSAARTVFGLGEDHVVVGVTGRLIEGKGHELAMNAAAEAASGGVNIRLLVAGDGPLRERLEAQAKSHPDTIGFVGHVEDVRGFIGACDIAIVPTLPTLGEGFGLSALEAMAVGRPVIVSDVAALPEVVQDGVTGIVVAPRTGPMAAAISHLATDPGLRARMGEAGRDRAASVFGLDRMVSATRVLYAEALERR